MAMKDVSDQKRIYELRWKYLQQSDDYKNWLETYSKKYVNWDAWWGTHTEAGDDEKRKHVLKGKGFDPKWTTLYDLMGRVNVHTVSFDEWWERKKRRLDNSTPIDHYVNWAGHEINNCWINMKERPSDPEEFEKQFRKEFVDRMKESPHLYIIVNPDGDRETLKAGFLAMVDQKRKEKRDFYRMTREFSLPIGGKIHIDDLEKYLEVFILKERKHKGWKEIISLVSPKYDFSPSGSTYEEARRIHQRYLQKAKIIIRNAEVGRFPGDY
jgi:hypothetical protein